MPKLKFSTMVADAASFKPYITDGDFSHFVFQLTTEDTGGKMTYDLVIFAVYYSTLVPNPVNPKYWVAVSEIELGKRINMGNLVLTKDQLIKIYINNPAFDYIKFTAFKMGTGKYARYVIFRVSPSDKTGIKLAEIRSYSEDMNPSPPG